MFLAVLVRIAVGLYCLFQDAFARKPFAGLRSSKWPAVQKAHLLKEPYCRVCGGKKQLNAHHKLPFHLFPEYECDPQNLITLCNKKRCHITFGHGGDFKAYNPDVEKDVARANEMIKNRKYGSG